MLKVTRQQANERNQPAAKKSDDAIDKHMQTGTIAQLKAMTESSPQLIKLSNSAAMIESSPRQQAMQKFSHGINSRRVSLAQRMEDSDPLQGKFVSPAAVQLKENSAARHNESGLPRSLKNGIESLSGMSMDHVKVHYNSAQPAQLSALAYAQGNDIHLAPGQEQHLPHEAWHVVQQAQGRVQPTMQMKEGVPVNDDIGLENEADLMGNRAAQFRLPTELDATTIGSIKQGQVVGGREPSQMKESPTSGSLPAIQLMKLSEVKDSWLAGEIAEAACKNPSDEVALEQLKKLKDDAGLFSRPRDGDLSKELEAFAIKLIVAAKANKESIQTGLRLGKTDAISTTGRRDDAEKHYKKLIMELIHGKPDAERASLLKKYVPILNKKDNYQDLVKFYDLHNGKAQ